MARKRPAEDEQDIQQAQNTITYKLMARERPAEDQLDIQQHKTQSHTS